MADPRRLDYVVLARAPDDARQLAEALQRGLASQLSDGQMVQVPPVRGRAYFAGDERQRRAVSRWLSEALRPDAVPIFLLMHEEGLPAALLGLNGVACVGVRETAEAEAYSGVAAARTVRLLHPAEDGVQQLADAALAAGNPSAAPTQATGPVPHPLDLLIAQSESRRERDLGRVDWSTSSRHGAPSMLDLGDDARTPTWGAKPGSPRLARGQASAPQPRHRLAPVRQTLSAVQRLTGSRRSSATAAPSDAGLAAAIMGGAPRIVVMGSRKGGVGKTSHAAGVAIVAGRVLDRIGHKAAIVDANVANPDAWGQMNLPARAATVRDVVVALSSNRQPPPPIYATTAALACFPESRDAGDYGLIEIGRFAEYLRSRYSFTVVDMSNRLPDPLAGPEAAVAAYWLRQADALVLPTTSSKQDFNGVLDYLDVDDLPPTVVAYTVSSLRRNREHPMTLEYVSAIRERVTAVVEVPDQADQVRFAGMQGVPVEQVSPQLGAAYRQLTQALARLPARVAR